MSDYNLNQTPQQPVFSNYVTGKSLAKMLNTSTWTIQNLRKNCGMPYIKLGGRFYYDVNEVDTWFRSNVHYDKPAPLYSPPASQHSNKAMAKIY